MKEYILAEKEVHMVGDYVGVCWNLSHKTKKLKGDDGITYSAAVPFRSGKPYIDFPIIREIDEEVFESEDSSIAGGIGAEQALQVSKELEEAANYMRGLK